MNTIAPTVMTVKEACAYLRISSPTLYRLAKVGVLRLSHMGGRTLILKTELDAALQHGMAHPTQEGRRGRPRKAVTSGIFG